MRKRDTIQLAVQKLRQRWGRALFAIIAFAIALVPPILILDLYKGARATITGFASSSGQDPAQVSVWRSGSRGSSSIIIPLAEKDHALIAKLPGLIHQQVQLRLHGANLYLDENDRSGNIRGEEESFVAKHLAPGESFADSPDIVPVILGKLSFLYRLNDQYDAERTDRDPKAFIGKTIELRAGDIYQNLRRRKRDRTTGTYRDCTEAELQLNRDKLRARIGAEFDLDKYDRKLSFPARIVGIRDGFDSSIPMQRAEQIKTWLAQRARDARRFARDEWPKSGKRISLMFDSEVAAEAAGKTLEDQGYKVASYHKSVDHSFSQVRIAVWLIGGVVAVMLLMACFLVSSVLARVILDAKQEIGLLRALGARQSHILRIYLFEAALLCGLGSLLGMVVGNAAAAWIGHMVISSASEQTSDFYLMGRWISLYQIDTLPESLWEFAPLQLLWVLAAIGLAMLSAYIPARRSSRLDPTDALRME